MGGVHRRRESVVWARIGAGTAVLSLDDAFARALEKHPGLARFSHLREGALARTRGRNPGPPLRLEFELENAPRSDQDSSFDTAEATLSLASVIERGGKREARARLAEPSSAHSNFRKSSAARICWPKWRGDISTWPAQAMADLEAADVTQREKVVRPPRSACAPARRRNPCGWPRRRPLPAPRCSETAQARTPRRDLEPGGSLEKSRCGFRSRVGRSARRSRDSHPGLLARTDRAQPRVARFANESRLQEARVQLARSAGSTDIEWRAGVRWLEEDGTWAAVAGVSIPLGSSSRAGPATRAAQAELAALSLARETESLTLETTLIDAHLRLSGAAAEVAAARDVLLPKLDQAEQSAARAFRAGALTYTEWAQLQGDVSGRAGNNCSPPSKPIAHSSKSNDSPARPLSRPVTGTQP